MEKRIKELFDLSGKTAVITGGSGLLGYKHAESLMEAGANCVLVDICKDRTMQLAAELTNKFDGTAIGIHADITSKKEVEEMKDIVINHFGNVHILINNAANNPKFEEIEQKKDLSKRLETFSVSDWNADISVGLTGAFICSQIFGTLFAAQHEGVILNISSDLGVIAPDQRIYQQEGLAEEEQPTKPITYSVIKTGLIGMTRYLATYWANKGVRCNALVPGGVYTGQNEAFVKKLTNLIPMGRMAEADEYKAAVLFLCSDASKYMTGATLNMEGGRTCW
ncbi:SDR family oxidoreductase [Lachnospiraceae bacterium 42-17]